MQIRGFVGCDPREMYSRSTFARCYQSIPIDGGFLKWGTPSYPFIDGFFHYNPTILGIPRLWKSPDVFPVQMPLIIVRGFPSHL